MFFFFTFSRLYTFCSSVYTLLNTHAHGQTMSKLLHPTRHGIVPWTQPDLMVSNMKRGYFLFDYFGHFTRPLSCSHIFRIFVTLQRYDHRMKLLQEVFRHLWSMQLLFFNMSCVTLKQVLTSKIIVVAIPREGTL